MNDTAVFAHGEGRLVWYPFDVQASCGGGSFDGAGYATLKAAKQAARAHLRSCDFCREPAEGIIITMTGLVTRRQLTGSREPTSATEARGES